MTRFAPFAAALVLLAVGPVGALLAQPQVPGGGARRPSYSPYLGLLAGGRNPAYSYFGIVQPQMQNQQAFGQLQQQIQQNAQSIQSLNNNLAYGEDQNFPLTGHAATFGNLSHYYGRSPGASGSSGGGMGGGMSGGMSGGGMGRGGMGRGGMGMSSPGGSSPSRGGSVRR